MSEQDKRTVEESGKYSIRCTKFQEVIDIDLLTRIRLEGEVLTLWFEKKSGIEEPVQYFARDFEEPTWLALQQFFMQDYPKISKLED